MDEINLKNFPQDIATTSNITKDTKVLIANGVNTYVTTLSAISKLLGVNSEKVESVSPGELPYLDTKNNRYMEVTETGDYYFEGELLANNPRGYITVFWWENGKWVLSSQYRVIGDKGDDVNSIEVDNNGDLIISYSTGVVENAGRVKGVGVDDTVVNESGFLILTYDNGEVKNAGKVKGDVGEGLKIDDSGTLAERNLITPTEGFVWFLTPDNPEEKGFATVYTNGNWFDWSAATGSDVLNPEGNGVPKSKAVAKYIDNFISENDYSDDIASVISGDGKYIAFIDKDGKSPLIPTDEILELSTSTKEDDLVDDVLLAMEVKDNEGNIKRIPIIDKNGDLVGVKNSSDVSAIVSFPIDKSKGNIDVLSVKKLPNLTLNGIAVGRESTLGAGDAPEVILNNNGWTHPSVCYTPGGWNGYPFWMALTPTFGKIAQQPDSAAYENPHIYCSIDGITWEEPLGMQNPIDTPDPADTIIGGINHGNSYWSDTDLKIGSDGYMNLYYRGSNMSSTKLNATSGRNFRALVHRRIQSPTKIGEKRMIYSTDSVGVDDSSVLASPGFINAINHWEVFDVVDTTPSHPYLSQGCTGRAVMRRFGSNAFSFDNYNEDNVVNFTSRPWGASNEVWHLEAQKINGTYILLLNVGPNGLSISDSLWIAYSADGFTFDVIQTPIFTEQTYRSTMILKESNDDLLTFWVYQANRITGEIILNEVKLKYN